MPSRSRSQTATTNSLKVSDGPVEPGLAGAALRVRLLALGRHAAHTWRRAAQLPNEGWFLRLRRTGLPPRTEALLRYLSGYYAGDRMGSQVRRFLGRMTLAFCLAIVLLYAIGRLDQAVEAIAGWAVRGLVAWAIFYFFAVVVAPVILVTNRTFQINPFRLVLDILTSAFYSILIFGVFFMKFCIVASAEDMALLGPSDALYFSAVTFSTLGFGDFRPGDAVRGYAAIQGIWGNIHLGLFAGAVFFALQSTAGRDQARPVLRGDALRRQIRRSQR